MADFEWVKARSTCSVAEMFTRLKLEVEQDVKVRNALRPAEAYYGFRVVTAKDSFAVAREGNQVGANVAFFCRSDRIDILCDEKALLTAKVVLNDDGECVFDVNGDQKQSWHLRNIALAPIFFEGI
jgi:hypothetical protein